jgi:PII-like signaling protein
MLAKGIAKKVTIYLNEDTQHHLSPLYEAILAFLVHKGVSGATVTRALAGFGTHRVVHTPKIEVLAEHLPLRLEFIESAQKVDELLPSLYEMVTDGLIEVQETTVVKSAARDRAQPTPKASRERTTGKAKLMRIYIGEADRWNGEPLYDAIVKRLHMMDIAGATVYKGIEGYGAKGHTHRQNLLHTNRDLPVMIEVMDAEEKLKPAMAAIEEMIEDGMIAMSEVEIVRLLRGD